MRGTAMRLFVANINYAAAESQLESFFGSNGFPVSVRICLDDKAKSRGYGFVEIDGELAQDAVQAMHAKEFQGRVLHVAIAEDRPSAKRKKAERKPRLKRYVEEGGRRCRV